jgi:hypothetical protein
MSSLFTPEDAEKVKELATKLGVEALAVFQEHPLCPLLALAALTTAATQVAVISDTTYAQLMELVTVHYQAAAVGVAVQELEKQLGLKIAATKIEKEPS